MRDRLGEVADIDRLEVALGRDHRKERQARHRGEAVGEVVLRPEDERRADDRRVGKGLADCMLAFALGSAVVGLRVSDPRRSPRLDERPRRPRARPRRRCARRRRAPAASPAEDAGRGSSTARRAFDRVADAGGVGDVGLLEPELADLRERLKEIGVARVAARDAHPDSAPEQEFADVAADEAGAAEDGDKLFRGLDHGAGAIAPRVPSIDKAGAAFPKRRRLPKLHVPRWRNW